MSVNSYFCLFSLVVGAECSAYVGIGQVDKSVQLRIYKAPWKGSWLLS